MKRRFEKTKIKIQQGETSNVDEGRSNENIHLEDHPETTIIIDSSSENDLSPLKFTGLGLSEQSAKKVGQELANREFLSTERKKEIWKDIYKNSNDKAK